MTRIGFVGLGAMGMPMARCLISAGHQLTVFDVAAARMRSLEDLGARPSDSPQDAADGARALVVMVAKGEQAEQVLFGEEGAVYGMAAGSSVILMSTIGPEAVRDLDRRLEERGLHLLDAPVSGGVARAERGDLLIMAGGPGDLFSELKPVLDAMGSSVVQCGPRAGDGQSVKLVNQLLCGVHIAVAAEALAYAERLGLDARFVFETIRHGAANSFMLEDRGERMLQRSFEQPKSALDIFVKDMGLVLSSAGEMGFSAPLADAASRVYQAGAEMGLGSEDDSGVIRAYES